LLRRRARHVVGENERVQRAVELLANGNARGVGELMNESHQSSRENFENSTPELDVMVEIARAIPGVLGARLTGAGFGGAVVALCERADAHTAARQLHGAYLNETGIDSDPFVCEIGAGAH
jgi:galactokinase